MPTVSAPRIDCASTIPAVGQPCALRLLDYCHRYALAMVRLVETLEGLASCSIMRPTRANKPNGYLLGSYRIATAPEPNSSRLTSFKATPFASPANNVGPCPASLRCTTNSYSPIHPTSPNATGSL